MIYSDINTRGNWTWLLSLVFVFKIISTFIGQNPKFFLCMCWRRIFCFSDHNQWETNLKSILFKVVLIWKPCWSWRNYRKGLLCESTPPCRHRVSTQFLVFSISTLVNDIRDVTWAIIGRGGGGGVYSYIRVMPDGFLLKSTQLFLATLFPQKETDLIGFSG